MKNMSTAKFEWKCQKCGRIIRGINRSMLEVNKVEHITKHEINGF